MTIKQTSLTYGTAPALLFGRPFDAILILCPQLSFLLLQRLLASPQKYASSMSQSRAHFVLPQRERDSSPDGELSKMKTAHNLIVPFTKTC